MVLACFITNIFKIESDIYYQNSPRTASKSAEAVSNLEYEHFPNQQYQKQFKYLNHPRYLPKIVQDVYLISTYGITHLNQQHSEFQNLFVQNMVDFSTSNNHQYYNSCILHILDMSQPYINKNLTFFSLLNSTSQHINFIKLEPPKHQFFEITTKQLIKIEDIQPIKTQRKKRQPKPLEEGKLSGAWTLLENKLYHIFLEIYHFHFQHKHLRRMDRIFKKMADFIGTRAAHQCRSHHQKMQKKYHSFIDILYNLRLANYSSLDTNNLQMEIKLMQIEVPSLLIDPFKLLTDYNISLSPKEVKIQQQEQKQVKSEYFGQKYFQQCPNLLDMF